MIAALLIALSYLAGSVPFALLIGLANGVDIRKFGSGNVGATNLGRAAGLRYGLLAFALDFLKGFGPALVAKLYGSSQGRPDFERFDLPVLCALAAVLGHVFPVWLRFRGGKAGATGLGVGAVLCWPAMLVAAVVWLLVWAATRYISLATMLGSVAFSIAYIVFAFREGSPFDREHASLTAFCAFAMILVIVRHWSNIQRLSAGTEAKV
jgi:glycerol-3-phosphate acyltransferase PlsY